MTAPRPAVDEKLAAPRGVLKSRPDGAGYLLYLSCGHEVWTAVPAGRYLYCGQCLCILAEQARMLARSQERPAPAEGTAK